jgi:choline dehydrogenase-like flavoprotein
LILPSWNFRDRGATARLICQPWTRGRGSEINPHSGRHARHQAHAVRHLIDANAHRHARARRTQVKIGLTVASPAHDWPIAYEDVAPWYDKVAYDIGISGDAKAEGLWRPAGRDYPMPPMKTFKNGEVWLKGFAANNIRMVPAAVAMNSVDFKGRPACIYDGWCHVGCPIGALANPLVTYLGEARAAGAEVRAWSTVTRVLTDASGKKATGVEYFDRDGEKHIQPASVVVCASWAAQSPRLLLNSATDKHPNGLANASGLDEIPNGFAADRHPFKWNRSTTDE